MAYYRHSVWLSVVHSVSGRHHTTFGSFRMFQQDGRANDGFRTDFQSFRMIQDGFQDVSGWQSGFSLVSVWRFSLVPVSRFSLGLVWCFRIFQSGVSYFSLAFHISVWRGVSLPEHIFQLAKVCWRISCTRPRGRATGWRWCVCGGRPERLGTSWAKYAVGGTGSEHRAV